MNAAAESYLTLTADRVRLLPVRQVMWYRVKGTPLDEAHYERYEEGYTFGLRIANVKDDDLGVYSCQAENVIGKHTAIVHLTGG